jgi:hypothetical protein
MANERARKLGYKYITDDKYLVDPFSPTDGISYEGDGSPVSYANSGIMAQAPAPLQYIPQGGNNNDNDNDDDDNINPYTGPSVSPWEAAKAAGLFALNPPAYLLQKIASKGIRAFKDYRNKNKIEKYTQEPMSNYRDDRPSSEKNYTGGDTNSNPSTPGAQDSFSNKSGMGRTGYFFGGRVNYKAGGRTDAESQYGADSAGSYDSSQNQSGREQSYGGDNNPSFYEPKTSVFNNPEILSKETIIGDVPMGIGFDNSYGRYKATMDLEESLKEKGLEGEIEYNSNIGNFDLAAKYNTQDGPSYGAGYTGNNFDVGFNNKTGASASYSKDIFDGRGKITAGGTRNPDGTYNAEGKIIFNYANGGLASIL